MPIAVNGRPRPGELAPIPGGQLAKAEAAHWNTMCVISRQREGSCPMPNGSLSSIRLYAGQVMLRNSWCARGRCSNAAVPGTSNHGWGKAVDTSQLQQAYRNGKTCGVRSPSDAPWECVPMDTRILTRRGLVAFEEIRSGDETVGYDPATGRTAWTPILDARRLAEAEVVRYAHSTFEVRCTANHRWVTAGRPQAPRHALEPLGAARARDPQGRVLLAAAGATGDGLPITPAEAALIGWGLTDGSIYRFATRGGPRASVRIYQRKPVGVEAVDALMRGFEHQRQATYNGGDCVAWYVGRGVFSSILHRSGLDELGVVRFVLALDGEQRAAFLDAVRMAEGEQGIDTRRIAQSEPDRREAFAIAAALEGHLVAMRPRTVNLKHSAIRVGNLTAAAAGIEDVWCPTTGLGTWTAEQDGQIFLTGNSWHALVRIEGTIRSAPTGPRVIRPGSRDGDDVKTLQVLLRRAGCLRSSWKAHRSYTATVQRAVRSFQRKHGLTADAVVGPTTLRVLKAAT